MKKHLTFAAITLLLFSCQPKTETTDTAPADYCSQSGIAAGTELSDCTTTSVYTSPVTVSGTAVFYRRSLTVNTVLGNVSSITLGPPVAAPLPIRGAEVRVLNGAGSVVQCGRTDAGGVLKAVDGSSPLLIPNTAGNYTVQVLAKSHMSMPVPGGKTAFQLNASVKSVCSESLHRVETIASSSGTGTVSVSLTAYAREADSATVNGGAFNILNNIYSTYDYLANNTGNLNLSCLSPKLNVYWTAGFNPAQLIDPSADPSTLSNVSFYLRGYNELYINGGKLGNITQADTDHFDDSVIIHELGHRVEDACGKMDSPGGSHYGQFRIDPRLAWSEGWGNFFGAHIVRNMLNDINPEVSGTLSSHDGWLYYLDTEGYVDGAITSGNELIRINLSRAGSNPEYLGSGLYYDKVDATDNPGEGHFLDVSVSRSLFKSTNTCASGFCTGLSYFDKMWEAFQNISSGVGMGKVTYPFRSSVRFYDRLKAVSAGGNLPVAISTMLNTDEAQQPAGSGDYAVSSTTKWVPYGIKLVSSGISGATSPCPLAIQPRTEAFLTTNQKPDQRYSNHFYFFDRTTLPTVTDIYLNMTKVAGSSVDVDLVLYQEGYNYPVENCLDANCNSHSKNLTSSEFVRSDRATPADLTSYQKHIATLSNLSSAVPYLLNVRAYTSDQTVSGTTEYNYSLKDQSGVFLCPSGTF